MTILLSAIYEAITEQPINGHEYHLDPTANNTNSFRGTCNKQWICVWQLKTHIRIISPTRHYDIPVTHPTLIEETLIIIHTIVNQKHYADTI